MDFSAWPLVEVNFADEWTDEAFEAYLDALRQNLDRAARAGKKTAILFNASGGNIPATQRKRQADWIKENKDLSSRFCSGYAFVLNSAMLRGALTAILWVVPMPAPHTVVSEIDEGRAWLRERLILDGVP